MTRRPVSAAVATALVPFAAAVLAACGGQDETGAPSGDGAAATLPQGGEAVELDPADFSPEVTNRYWPMEAGTRWTFREVDEEGTELEVVVTATSETKEIANGITARVVRDTVSEDGQVIEDTRDWYAQDSAGSVWYMGEDTAEFDKGKLTTSKGSFEAGVDGALPGIVLPAEPADGMTYRQEYYEGEAEDNGEILAVGEQVEVAAGHYEDALMTKDTNALEPKVLEVKMYAPGVGPVLALGISGGGDREELLRVEQVSAGAAKAAATTPLGESYP